MVRGAPLEVAVEFDAIGRVKVNALHLAAQAFAPCQRLRLGGGNVFAQFVIDDRFFDGVKNVRKLFEVACFQGIDVATAMPT